MKYGKFTRKYNPQAFHPLNIDRQSLDQVPKGSKVLDIGCASGFMGEYLQDKKQCTVIGVEMGNDEAKDARKKLSKVVLGDIESKETILKVKKDGQFDVILACAIIEHLKNPTQALITWKSFLKPDGILIITTPNIAHWSMRFSIMRGRFNYSEYGILDNTHLHFFTPDTFKDSIKIAGYKIEKYAFDAVGGGYPKVSLLGSLLFPNIFAYQMLIVAKK